MLQFHSEIHKFQTESSSVQLFCCIVSNSTPSFQAIFISLQIYVVPNFSFIFIAFPVTETISVVIDIEIDQILIINWGKKVQIGSEKLRIQKSLTYKPLRTNGILFLDPPHKYIRHHLENVKDSNNGRIIFSYPDLKSPNKVPP